MRSTQLSESLNATLNRYLQADHNIVQFFTHFNRIVVDKRYEEVKAIYNSRQQLSRMKLKRSPILNQVVNLYTPHIFDLFHNELDMSLSCRVKQCHELEGVVRYVISLYGDDRKYIVEALDKTNVMEIPERYILGRWRLDAKSGEIKGGKVEVDENDPKLEISARYRDLCPRMVKLATQASMYKPTYQLVDEGIKELCTKVNKMMVSFDDLGDCGSGSNIDMSSNPNFARVKGLKKNGGQKGRGRLKPWHEKTNKRIKIISQPTGLSKGMSFDEGELNPTGGESFLDNETF
ncbi:hypothetical protein ACSBR1_032292 [Camellia fascicularis]